jgi:acyl carrier protein
MTPTAAEGLVREVVAAHTGLVAGELTVDAGLRAGTWTSLQHLTVLLAVAERVGFALDARLVRDLNTIEDLVRHVVSTDNGGGYD